MMIGVGSGSGVLVGVGVLMGVGNGSSSGVSSGVGVTVGRGVAVAVGVGVRAFVFVFVPDVFVLPKSNALLMPRFELIFTFAFRFEFAFELAALFPRPRNSQIIPALMTSSAAVPNIVKKTTRTVFDLCGCCWAVTTRVRGVSGCDIGTTIRGGCSSRGSNSISSMADTGGGKFIRRTTVTSPSSSSTGATRLSLGISINFGSLSSTSGVPSFMQKRKMSSSYRVSQVGQNFIVQIF